MPSDKISQMPTTSTLTGEELVPIVTGSTNYICTTGAVAALAAAGTITSGDDMAYRKRSATQHLKYKP